MVPCTEDTGLLSGSVLASRSGRPAPRMEFGVCYEKCVKTHSRLSTTRAAVANTS